MFRVVPDQLRISEGWVRCGQCDEAFDASQNLFQESAVSAPESAPEPVATESAQPAPLMAQGTWLTESSESRDVRDEIQVDLPREDRPAASPDVQAALLNVIGNPEKSIEVTEHIDVDLPGQIFQAGQSTQNTFHELPAVSFMRAMPKRSMWHQPWVRAVLGLMSFVLVVALAAQLVVHERDRLVAMQPQIRPVLDALCATLKCELSTVRQIESIVIDNASFSKIRAESYRLGLSVKNTAAIDLAMPSLELTLTDSQDQTVLRRVLLPAEFGATSDVLVMGSEWSGTVALDVRGATGAERISGYRVLVFYP
jgi:predicted Zn finger-like uncharacterized protein